MSLYGLQKLIYEIIRDRSVQDAFLAERESVLARYPLHEEEAEALRQDDIGKLYVLGVNGQLLMHFAAWRGLAWDEYIEAMRQGLETHGPVRAGIYVAADGSTWEGA